MAKWSGLYNTDKRVNKQVAMALLAVLFLQAIGLLAMIGLDLSTIGSAGFNVLNVVLVVASAWMLYGLHKRKIGG